MAEREAPWVAGAVAGALAPWLVLLARGGVPLAHDVAVSDLLHSFAGYDVAIGEALRSGRLPLWLDGPFLGVNLAGQVEAGIFYPPRWLLAVLSPWTAFDVVLLLHVIIAATGAYALARRAGASPVGAALAGAATGGGGFLVAHVKHPNLVGSVAWAPWALAAATAVGARPWPWWPIGAAAIGATWLAGHPQGAFYATFAATVAAVLAAALEANERSFDHRERAFALARSLGRSGSMVAVGVAVAAIAILPTAAAVGHTLRSAPSWGFAARFPLDPLDLGWWLAPGLRGCPYDGSYAPTAPETLPWENYAPIGTIPLLLAVVAPLGPARVRAWALLVAVGLGGLFALGPATPVYGLVWSFVPGFGAFRFPVRALFFVGLGLAVLAAWGLDAALAGRDRRLGAVAVALTAAQLTIGHAPWLTADRPAVWGPASDVADAIRADGGARVYVLDPTGPWRAAFEAGGAPPQLAETARWPILNRARVLGLGSPAGYTAYLHERTAWFWILVNRDQIAGAPQLPTATTGHLRLAKAGVTHVIGADLALPEVARWGDLAVGRLDARPVAFTTGAWAAVADRDAARALAEADPRVVLEDGGVPGGGDPAAAAVVVRRDGPNALSVDVTGRSGLLVIAEAWDEGWTATIDGVPAPVLVADGYLRAVRLPPGARQVRMGFWPEGLSAGLAGTAVGLLAWGIGLLVARFSGGRA